MTARWWRVLLAALLSAVTLTLPSPAWAVTVVFCAEYRLNYSDDGTGIGDDYFTDQTGEWFRQARGAHIKVIDDDTGATVQDVYTLDSGAAPS